MSEQEIKELFKIDIREKNRSFENYTMRMLWSIQNKKNFNTITALSKYLNLGHGAVLSMFKHQNKHITDPKFIVLKEAFEKKDINIFNKYFYLKDKLYFEQLIILKENRKPTEKDQVVKKYEKTNNKNLVCQQKESMQNVIKTLRPLPKNHQAYYLWNKPLQQWSVADWETYYKI
jgi:hypothetical protein